MVSLRAIMESDTQTQWFSGDGVRWHETVGVFLKNETGRFLLFDRLIYPFGWTVPAGHLDRGESPQAGARRELAEETGVVADVTHLLTVDIDCDSCVAGGDAHRWHVFLACTAATDIVLNEEGRSAMWTSFAEAADMDLVLPVRYLVEKFSDKIG